MEELRSQTEDSKAIQISHSRKLLPPLELEEHTGGGEAKIDRGFFPLAKRARQILGGGQASKNPGWAP